MSSTNVRVRGKIRREEWSRIAERFQQGETLTEIARSYGCTAPAIRYIVRRATPNAGKPKASRAGAAVAGSESERGFAGGTRSAERGLAPVIRERSTAPSSGNEIWARINNDIVAFLAAIDALFASENDSNYEALLRATDRLLWASARTRLELERVLGNRRPEAARRRLSA
jgi:hypothetical protein